MGDAVIFTNAAAATLFTKILGHSPLSSEKKKEARGLVFLCSMAKLHALGSPFFLSHSCAAIMFSYMEIAFATQTKSYFPGVPLIRFKRWFNRFMISSTRKGRYRGLKR